MAREDAQAVVFPEFRCRLRVSEKAWDIRQRWADCGEYDRERGVVIGIGGFP
jgi:hypothetical protein